MEVDLYSEAAAAILSFVCAVGTYQVDGSKFVIEVPDGMDAGKVEQLSHGEECIVTQIVLPVQK